MLKAKVEVFGGDNTISIGGDKKTYSCKTDTEQTIVFTSSDKWSNEIEIIPNQTSSVVNNINVDIVSITYKYR